SGAVRGTTRGSSPNRQASAADIGSPLKKYRRAALAPIAPTTYGLTIDGTRPIRTSEIEKTTSPAAITTSQAATSPTPAAYAGPLTRAIVGFVSSLSVRIIVLIVLALAKFSISLQAAIQSRSAPAENAAPLPVRTTIRVAASAPRMKNASVSRRMTSSLIALRTFGRFIVTVAT